MFDPRFDETTLADPPGFDLSGQLAKTERLNCPVSERARLGVEIDRAETDLIRAQMHRVAVAVAITQAQTEADREVLKAEAELAKAKLLHALDVK